MSSEVPRSTRAVHHRSRDQSSTINTMHGVAVRLCRRARGARIDSEWARGSERRTCRDNVAEARKQFSFRSLSMHGVRLVLAPVAPGLRHAQHRTAHTIGARAARRDAYALCARPSGQPSLPSSSGLLDPRLARPVGLVRCSLPAALGCVHEPPCNDFGPSPRLPAVSWSSQESNVHVFPVFLVHTSTY